MNEEYWRLQEFLIQYRLSCHDHINRAILFTSLPILGLTIAFFNTGDTSANKIDCLFLFVLSSVCLILAVFCVIGAYWSAIVVIKEVQGELRAQVSQDPNTSEFSIGPESIYSKIVTALSTIAVWLYILGVSLIFVFFYSNFPK